MKVTTTTGFKCEVDERVLDDYRLVDSMRKLNSSDEMTMIEGLTTIVDLILGKEKERLFEHIMSYSDGFVNKNAMDSETREIVQALKLKNSGSSQKP